MQPQGGRIPISRSGNLSMKQPPSYTKTVARAIYCQSDELISLKMPNLGGQNDFELGGEKRFLQAALTKFVGLGVVKTEV